MLAIVNDDLVELLNKVIVCPQCNGNHIVQQSIDSVTGNKGSLQFYECSGETYLCGIAGKSILNMR